MTFVQDNDGNYVYNEEKDIYVPVYAGVGANNRYRAIISQDVLPESVKLYARNDIEDYVDQNISFSVAGLVYFNSNGADTFNLGGLFESLFGEMLIELQTLQAFDNGIGFKLSANVDLGAINFAGLVDGSGEHGSILDSDFDKIELALELIETNERNDFVKIQKRDGTEVDKVLGGIYLHNGSLYLDATGLVDVVENYSKVDNFMTVLSAIIDKGKGLIGSISNLFGNKEETQDALAAAEGGDNEVARDAILALIYGDKALQVQLTRSILALLISSILPDLGSIEEVFDMFEISLNIQHGEEQFLKVSDIEKDVLDYADKTKHYEFKVGDDKYYVSDSYDIYHQDGEGNYVLALYDGEKTNYVYFKNDYRQVLRRLTTVELFDSELYADERYTYFAEENYETVDNENGKYAAVDFDGDGKSDKYLPISIYKLYHKDPLSGELVANEDNKFDTSVGAINYIVYNGVEKKVSNMRTRRVGFTKSYGKDYTLDKTGTYKKVGEEYFALTEEEYDEGNPAYITPTQRYLKEGDYYRAIRYYTRLDEFFVGLDISVGSMSMGFKVGGLSFGFGAGQTLLPSYIRDSKGTHYEVGSRSFIDLFLLLL